MSKAPTQENELCMQSVDRTECTSPATGEIIGYSAEHTEDDLIRAVQTIRRAQPAWAALPIRERIRALSGAQEFLTANGDEIASLISRENGKTRVEALATEVLPAAMALAYYARNGARLLKPRRLLPASFPLLNKWSKLLRIPYGVIGIISPWNYPFSIPFSEVVTGLIAGNGVILKTATKAQMVGRMIEACLNAASLPKGIFAFVNLPGSTAGDAFIRSGIDKLFFTGSVRVGKQLMVKAAETLTPLGLELGGNDAMLVCNDANLERAARGAIWAGFQNCGQSCGGVERVYVHEAVYGPFLEILKEQTESLRVGPDARFDVDMGAMTTRQQVETVRSHIDDALVKGATLFAQSPCPPPSPDLRVNFLPAMVLTDVHHGMLVMQEETFGPVLAVMRVGDMEEAVALANDSSYGLTGSVWSADTEKAERIGSRIQAGVITINDHLMSHGMPETPWGGMKASGFGRAHGEAGFHEMTQPQVIVHDILSFAKRDLWWHPYDESLYRGLLGALGVFYGSGLKARLKGLRPLLGVISRIFR